MDIKNKKDWTVLFYLNGNNELSYEIAESKKKLNTEGSNAEVNILIQHGRIEKRIVEIIRPQFDFSKYIEESAGVRRYHAASSNLEMSGNLENINMADPKSLYDFIRWGMENYPAKRYMLILGGHVFQYVGLMPDYSQDKPYLMGYPEMVNALTLIHKDLGNKIDLLVLDTCYANRIEMLYEFGKNEDPPVNKVLTYISGGPIQGLPYDQLINILKKHSDASDVETVREIIVGLPFDLIAYEISRLKLKEIKETYNDIACSFLGSSYTNCMNPSELLTNPDENLPWHPLLKTLSDKMPSLTIDYKNTFNSPFSYFYVSAGKIRDLYKIRLYFKLAFARNNSWADMLNETGFSPTAPDIGIEPYALNPSELYALITAMNPDLSFERHQEILRNLIAYKGWCW